MINKHHVARIVRFVALWLALFGLSNSCRAFHRTCAIHVVREAGGYLVRENCRPVLKYQRDATSWDGRWERAHYVHPLYDFDGNVLTEDFPEDHPHHRGVFWGWHQIWIGDHRVGDGWSTKQFEWDVRSIKVIRFTDKSAALLTQVKWKSPLWKNDVGVKKPFVDETTLIRVYPSQQNSQRIDFEIRLRALEENLRIGGSENVKGYGGFSIRMSLPENILFQGPAGRVVPQRTAVEAGTWVDVTESDGSAQSTGVAILCHPSHPVFPPSWILRNARSMQNVAYPGRHPIPLSTNTDLVLRYRLVLHRGRVEPATVESWQAEFAR